ncbi:DVU0772 family protein [Dissulfurispira sp.]|uniref:DVU0772 family protein n=1 Tax=Dissulfurispira sp. TaxID=2817609 RepID=UPI002FDB6BD4
MMFSKVLSLNDIKKESFVIEHIRWDLEPKDLMEPRYSITDEGIKTRETIKGYVFYIDTMDKKPILFLMRHTAADYAETLAQIDEIPQDLLLEAVEENKNKAYFGMYPINKKVEDWLKKELGAV